MSDIFISYAREDKSRVQTLAKALQDSGWSVWWDPHIPTGKRFDEVIEQAISVAKCIIVVWSKDSVSSTFVRAEASDGADRQILLPVMIDDVRIPLAFRQIQTARLVDWQGSTQDPEFVKLVHDISVLAGQESTLPPTAVTASNISSVSTVEADAASDKQTAPSKVSKGLILAGVAAAALLIVLFVWNYQNQKDQNTTATVNRPAKERSPEQTPTPTPTPTPVRSEEISIKTVSELVKNLKVKRLTFFQGDCPSSPPDGSLGQAFIENNKLGQTRWYLEFEHPKASRQIDFQIYARFQDPEGKSHGTMKLDKALIKPNSIHSWFCSEPPGLVPQRRLTPVPSSGRRLTPVPTLSGRPSVSLPSGSYKVEFFFRESALEEARKVDEVSIGIR